MDHLHRLGNSFSVAIQPGEDGLTGRECPSRDCESYFTIEFGTGLEDEDLPCHCPYCGYTAPHDEFWTKEQIAYAESVALREITDAFQRDMKELEFDHKPRGALGIGVSMKVQSGPSIPVRYYREKQLETEAVCANCTLRYSVYGVFAFCPDCGQHNSLQILDKNLEVVGKMLGLATGVDKELAARLVENAMEDCVSAFDGFGREICRVNAGKSQSPSRAEKTSFQNLCGARKNVREMFGFDLSESVSPEEWTRAVRSFQKRHLVAHRMGVVDEEYIAKTGDRGAVPGRKVSVSEADARSIMHAVRKMGAWLPQHDPHPRNAQQARPPSSARHA